MDGRYQLVRSVRSTGACQSSENHFLPSVSHSPVLVAVLSASHCCSMVVQVAGSFIPEPVANWSGVDVTSDAALSIMCFAGMGAMRLREIHLTDEDPDNAS